MGKDRRMRNMRIDQCHFTLEFNKLLHCQRHYLPLLSRRLKCVAVRARYCKELDLIPIRFNNHALHDIQNTGESKSEEKRPSRQDYECIRNRKSSWLRLTYCLFILMYENLVHLFRCSHVTFQFSLNSKILKAI